MKNLMDEYIPWEYSLRFWNFEIYHIYEEISHLKCHFSHAGSIPYLHSLENQHKILFGQKEICADNRMRVQLAEYDFFI